MAKDSTGLMPTLRSPDANVQATLTAMNLEVNL